MVVDETNVDRRQGLKTEALNRRSGGRHFAQHRGPIYRGETVGLRLQSDDEMRFNRRRLASRTPGSTAQSDEAAD